MFHDLSTPAKRVFYFCLLALLATIWPIYPIFGGIFPLVWGMPFSLFYLILVLVVVFLVMLGLYLWEERHDELE